MSVIDISVGIQSGMPVWPGDEGPEVRRMASIASGDEANVSHLSMGLHTGTHVDAPVHFVAGARGVDRMPLDALYGPCVVAHKQGEGHVTAEDIERMRLPEGVRRVLFKTSNSRLWERPRHQFDTGYAALTEDAARYLVSRGIALVGVDYLSIEPYDSPGRPVHHILLGEGIAVVEGLDLSGVEPGEYTLACLPVKIIGVDGAPARAVLIR